MHRDLAELTARSLVALLVDDRYAVPRVWPADRAGFHRPGSLAIPDHIVDLGLAEHFVDRNAEILPGPLDDRHAHRLPSAHDRAQVQVEAFLRLGDGLHHQFQRGREQERVPHPILFEEVIRLFGVEPSAVSEDRCTEMPRRQEPVQQPASPGPIGRRPEHVAGLRVEVVRMDEPGNVAEDRAVRLQGSLGGARSSTGVDDQRRVVSTGVDTSKTPAGLRKQRIPFMHTGFPRAGDADDVAQHRQLVLYRPEVRQSRLINDRDARLAVLHPVFKGIRPEEVRQGQRNCPHLEDRDVGDRHFGALWKHESNAIATLDSERSERIR